MEWTPTIAMFNNKIIVGNLFLVCTCADQCCFRGTQHHPIHVLLWHQTLSRSLCGCIDNGIRYLSENYEVGLLSEFKPINTGEFQLPGLPNQQSIMIFYCIQFHSPCVLSLCVLKTSDKFKLIVLAFSGNTSCLEVSSIYQMFMSQFCLSWDKRGPIWHMGVSENSVPLNPIVNDPYPY